MKEDAVSGFREDVDSCNYAAVYAVFIADMFGFQTFVPMKGILPLDNAVKICIRWKEVSVKRVAYPFAESSCDRGAGLQIPICDPHGALAAAVLCFLGCYTPNSRAKAVKGCGIFSRAVYYFGEIVGHIYVSP